MIKSTKDALKSIPKAPSQPLSTRKWRHSRVGRQNLAFGKPFNKASGVAGTTNLDSLSRAPQPFLGAGQSPTSSNAPTIVASNLRSINSEMTAQVACLPAPHRQSVTSKLFSQVACYTHSNQQLLLQLPKVIPPQLTSSLRHRSLSPQPVQNGPWTTEEDKALCDYRRRGFGWAQIQEKLFPSKSANACRKRHERLMTKGWSTDWDESRLQSLAVNYRQMREQIWGPLADRLGEKWEHVEKVVRKDVDIFSLTAKLLLVYATRPEGFTKSSRKPPPQSM